MSGPKTPPKKTGASAGGTPSPQPQAKPAAPKPAGGNAQKPQPVAQDTNASLHQRVFAIPGLKELRTPTVFTDFEEKLAPKIRMPETSRGILEAFASIDVKAEKIAQILRGNPYYEHLFLRYLATMGKSAEGVKLEAAIVLLGMQNSRNLILALQTLRIVKGTHPEWGKDGKLKVSPSEVLKYAIKTEESFGGRKGAYSDTAYAAGLVFDFMALAAQDLSKEPKKVLAYIDQIYGHGLRSAQIGEELAKATPDFSFTKFAFSTCLLHDIGKIALAILEPNYLGFVEDCAKRGLPRAARLFVEMRRFGITHAMLGGMIFERFQIFKTVSKAIYYHHDPYLIGGGKKGLGQLASLVSVATNIANHFKKTDNAEDPVLKQWKTLEVKGFPVDIRKMMAAAAKVN